MFNVTKEQKDFNYKKVHAMYSKGYSNEEICRECPNLDTWEVLDIIQKVEGRRKQAEERRQAR